MRSLLSITCSIVCVVALSAAATQNGTPAAPTEAISALPATFTGVLPCADCPGIRSHLNLLANGTYSLRMKYQDRKASFDERGSWNVSEDGSTLRLKSGAGHTTSFRIVGRSTLEQLDREGKPITSGLHYKLTRRARFEPLKPRTKAGSTPRPTY